MGQRARPAIFRTIPLSQLIEQANGVEVREPVYYFGKTIKVQDIELPGQTYAWARDITPPEQEGN